MYLSRAAGWNQLEADWQRLLALAPEGCFGVELDRTIVATATAVCFGDRLAWVGMVLTHPSYRRRGLARILMDHALAYLEHRRIAWIKLDATDMGRPLYRKLRFEDEAPIERWVRPASPSARPVELPPFACDAALDASAFGANRTAMLTDLARCEAASLPGEGYAMGRPGDLATSFAPCVARSAKAAARLLEWFLARHPGETVYWDLLPDNEKAVHLARDFGFERQRELIRMVRPGLPGAAPLEFDISLLYATAGFEYG